MYPPPPTYDSATPRPPAYVAGGDVPKTGGLESGVVDASGPSSTLYQPPEGPPPRRD